METSVYIETTYNPYAFKFVLNKIILPDAYKVYYRGACNLEESNLMYKLFNDYLSVDEIFINENYLCLRFCASEPFADSILNEIKDVISQFFKRYEFINSEYYNGIESIKNVLHNYVNPVLEVDGGMYEIEQYSVKEKTLTLIPLGSLRKSPSVQVDLEQIKALLGKVEKVLLSEINAKA